MPPVLWDQVVVSFLECGTKVQKMLIPNGGTPREQASGKWITLMKIRPFVFSEMAV